ncbi:LLM class flavin-dependent oxidoreductase [Cryptosporangium arvum]|uniref:LLM class flavin-dependent oxidoreductase n=1 Tax=Cryptosporangium arvum TaxID=80871 RepID=UPI0004BB9D09|nr:LLM class flavin-dependent oxidoreductase [Cryptosporangium arvum]
MIDLFLLAGVHGGDRHGDALRDTVDYAVAAEDAGFDGVWLAEHHFLTYGACPSAVALAAYVLGRTRRITVGTAAAILPARHPVALAEETALLAAVAGDRFELGVGRGGPWVDLEVLGTGLPRYTEGFAESLDLLLEWLSGARRVGADGVAHRFRPVRVVPRPTTPPRVRIAATTAASVDVAAARGLPLLLGMHAAPAEHRVLLDRYAAYTGGTVPPPAVAHLAYVADTVDQARAAVHAPLRAWLARTAEYVRLDGADGTGRDPDAYADRLVDLHPVGDAGLCVERLRRSREITGAGRLLLAVEAGGDRGRTLDCIARLAEEVLPFVR